MRKFSTSATIFFYLCAAPGNTEMPFVYGSNFPESLTGVGSLAERSWDALTGAFSSIVDSNGENAGPGLRPGMTGTQSKHKRLCVPSDDKRAYVTAFTGWPAEKLWGVRVLAQSLRENGGKADVVVMLPAVHAADRAIRQVMFTENLRTYVIPSSLPASLVPTELAAKVTAWALTAYQRVIFFEPSTLVLRNPDALFACEGFCIRREPRNEYDEKIIDLQQRQAEVDGFSQDVSGSYSTAVMVLEPSSSTFFMMRDRILEIAHKKRTLHGGVSPFEPRYNDDALSIGVGKSFELRGSSSGSSLPYTFDSGTAGLGRRYDSTSVRLSSADTAGFLTSFFDMGSCETFSGGTSDMSFVGSPPGSASAPQSPPIAHSSTTSGPSASIRSSSTLSGVGTNVWSPAAIAAAAAADLLTQRRHPLSGEILESRSSSSGSGEADHRNILSSGNSNMNRGDGKGRNNLMISKEQPSSFFEASTSEESGRRSLRQFRRNTIKRERKRGERRLLDAVNEIEKVTATNQSNIKAREVQEATYKNDPRRKVLSGGMATGSNRGSSGLSNSFTPFVILSNPSAVPKCSTDDFPLQHRSTCHLLSYTYNAPVDDLQHGSMLFMAPSTARAASVKSESFPGEFNTGTPNAGELSSNIGGGSNIGSSGSSALSPFSTGTGAAAGIGGADGLAGQASSSYFSSDVNLNQRAYPNIVRFNEGDQPWDALGYLRNPFFWRWNSYRMNLKSPYGEPADLWMLWAMLLLPFMLLSVSSILFNQRAVSQHQKRNNRQRNGGTTRSLIEPPHEPCRKKSSFDDEGCNELLDENSAPSTTGLYSPEKAFGVTSATSITSSAYGLSLSDDDHSRHNCDEEQGAQEHSLGGGDESRRSQVSGSQAEPQRMHLADKKAPSPMLAIREPLPLARICRAFVAAALGWLVGYCWFLVSLSASMALVHRTWHPVAAVIVYQSWLCVSLVSGLYFLDYLFFGCVCARCLLYDSSEDNQSCGLNASVCFAATKSLCKDMVVFIILLLSLRLVWRLIEWSPEEEYMIPDSKLRVASSLSDQNSIFSRADPWLQLSEYGDWTVPILSALLILVACRNAKTASLFSSSVGEGTRYKFRRKSQKDNLIRYSVEHRTLTAIERPSQSSSARYTKERYLAERLHFRLLVAVCLIAGLLVIWICCWSTVSASFKRSCFNAVTSCHRIFFAVLSSWIACPHIAKQFCICALCKAGLYLYNGISSRLTWVLSCKCIKCIGWSKDSYSSSQKEQSKNLKIPLYQRLIRLTVARCIILGVLWLILSSTYEFVSKKMPFQLPAQCFSHPRRGYLTWKSPGNSHHGAFKLGQSCDDTETFQVHYTDVYQEAYKQFKMCLRANPRPSPADLDATLGTAPVSALSGSMHRLFSEFYQEAGGFNVSVAATSTNSLEKEAENSDRRLDESEKEMIDTSTTHDTGTKATSRHRGRKTKRRRNKTKASQTKMGDADSGVSSLASTEIDDAPQFLTLDRRTTNTCGPDNQFVLQTVDRSRSIYCLYNPVHGKFVSTGARPSTLCKDSERFRARGYLRAREGLELIIGIVPSFSRASFMVRSPMYALLAYILLAGWEYFRPTHPRSQTRLYARELISAAVWFMISLQLLYFVAYANENYVFGSRAFREAANSNWQTLEYLESWFPGMIPLLTVLRRRVSAIGAQTAPPVLCIAMAILRLGSTYVTAIIALLHTCYAALRGHNVVTYGMSVNKEQYQRAKVAFCLAHLLAALACSAWPVARPLSLGAAPYGCPGTDGCWPFRPFLPPALRHPLPAFAAQARKHTSAITAVGTAWRQAHFLNGDIITPRTTRTLTDTVIGSGPAKVEPHLEAVLMSSIMSGSTLGSGESRWLSHPGNWRGPLFSAFGDGYSAVPPSYSIGDSALKAATQAATSMRATQSGSMAPKNHHVHLAMGYGVPVMFVMYAHMIFLIYYYHAAGQRRSFVRSGALFYFLLVVLSSIGLGFDGFITVLAAIGINLMAWRLAARTNTIVAKCCCPWLAPLTNTVRSTIWHSGYLLHKEEKRYRSSKAYTKHRSQDTAVRSHDVRKTSKAPYRTSHSVTSYNTSSSDCPAPEGRFWYDDSEKSGGRRSSQLSASTSVGTLSNAKRNKSNGSLASVRSVAAIESIATAREIGGTVVQSFNGLISMAWDGTGEDILGIRSRMQSESFVSPFGSGDSYEDEDEYEEESGIYIGRKGSGSADSDADFRRSPPLGALRNVRKTSDDFGDVLMMNDESLASSCHKMAASDHTSMPAPLTLQQRTKSDTAAASSLSSSWCRPLLGEDVFMSNSDKEVDSEAPLKRNGSQGMLRARSSA